MPQSSEKQVTYSDVVKHWATVVASIAGVVYVFGFIVIYSSLTYFGISNLELLQTKYFSAGLCFLFYLILAGGYLFPPSGTLFLQFVVLQNAKKAILIMVSVLIIQYLLTYFIMNLTMRIPGTEIKNLWLDALIWVIYTFGAASVATCLPYIISARVLKYSQPFTLSMDNRMINLGIVIEVIALVFLAAVFGLMYYLNVNQAFGGGRPSIVRLISYPDQTQIINQLIPPSGDGQTESNISAPLLLLHETSTSYVVISPFFELNLPAVKGNTLGVTPDNRFIQAVVVNKKIIAGIQYLTIRYGFP